MLLGYLMAVMTSGASVLDLLTRNSSRSNIRELGMEIDVQRGHASLRNTITEVMQHLQDEKKRY